MSHPATIRLSTAEGEAIIARLSVYAPSRSDCERLIQVLQWYFWLSAVVDEAKLSIHKLRTLLFGHRPTLPKPGDPEALADSCVEDEDVKRSDAAGLEREPVALGAGRAASPEAAIGRVLDAWGQMSMRGLSGWSAALRSWRWANAARSAGRGA